MDPLTAGVITSIATAAAEIAKGRSLWWSSLSPEKQTQLADKYADGEIRLMDAWDSVWKFITRDAK